MVEALLDQLDHLGNPLFLMVGDFNAEPEDLPVVDAALQTGRLVDVGLHADSLANLQHHQLASPLQPPQALGETLFFKSRVVPVFHCLYGGKARGHSSSCRAQFYFGSSLWRQG